MDVSTIWGWLRGVSLLLVDDFEVKRDLINGNCVLSGVVLLDTSEETLSKVETRHPETCWSTVFNPAINELKTFNEVYNV